MNSRLLLARGIVVLLLGSTSGCALFAELDEPLERSDEDAALPGPNGSDVGKAPDGAADADDCFAETDEALCAREAFECGAASVTDRCGAQRSIECGSCAAGECGAQSPNVCGCPCESDGRCYPEGVSNPENGCEVCDPARDARGWSVQVDAPCDDGDLCTVGDRCAATGICAPGPTLDCSTLDGECGAGVCDSATGECGFVVEPRSCFIDDACVAVGALNPANECQQCDPSRSTISWWHVNDGTTCGSGNPCRCEAGVCERPNGALCE